MLYTLRVEGVKPSTGETQGASPEVAGKKTTEKVAEGDNK